MKQQKHWGWIPLLALLPLSLLLTAAQAIAADLLYSGTSFFGWRHLLRLFLRDDVFWRAAVNTLLPMLLAGIPVAAAALLFKKCVWEMRCPAHGQGWFYGVTGALLAAVLWPEQKQTAWMAALIGYPSAEYNTGSLLKRPEDLAKSVAAGSMNAGVVLFAVSLCLLLVYAADRGIPARRKPVRSTTVVRVGAVGYLLFLLLSDGVFGAAAVNAVLFSRENIAIGQEGAFLTAFRLSAQSIVLLLILALLAAEPVLAVLFLRCKSRALGVAWLAVSAAAAAALWLLPPRILMISLYTLLRFGPINLIGTPAALWVSKYGLFHLLGLVCGAVTVYGTLAMPEKKPDAVPDTAAGV